MYSPSGYSAYPTPYNIGYAIGREAVYLGQRQGYAQAYGEMRQAGYQRPNVDPPPPYQEQLQQDQQYGQRRPQPRQSQYSGYGQDYAQPSYSLQYAPQSGGYQDYAPQPRPAQQREAAYRRGREVEAEASTYNRRSRVPEPTRRQQAEYDSYSSRRPQQDRQYSRASYDYPDSSGYDRRPRQDSGADRQRTATRNNYGGGCAAEQRAIRGPSTTEGRDEFGASKEELAIRKRWLGAERKREKEETEDWERMMREDEAKRKKDVEFGKWLLG